MENSKIDGGAAGSKGKTRRYCLKINGAECREKTTKKPAECLGGGRRRVTRRSRGLRGSIAVTESHPLDRWREGSGRGESARAFFFFFHGSTDFQRAKHISYLCPLFVTRIEAPFASLSARRCYVKNWTRQKKISASNSVETVVVVVNVSVDDEPLCNTKNAIHRREEGYI